MGAKHLPKSSSEWCGVGLSAQLPGKGTGFCCQGYRTERKIDLEKNSQSENVKMKRT